MKRNFEKKQQIIRSLFVLIAAALLLLSGCMPDLVTILSSDLTITLGTFDPAGGVTTVRGTPGGKLIVPVIISTPIGNSITGSYTVTFTLSGDADLSTTGDNIVLGEQELSAGSEEIVEISVAGTVPVATYTLFAAFSATDSVTNNNKASVTAEIGADNLPDLEISDFSLVGSGTYLPESTVTLVYQITNTGYAEVEGGTAFAIDFTADLSTVITTLGTIDLVLPAADPLYPQENISGTATITMPAESELAADNGEVALTSWTDLLTATVDTGNTVTEIIESDTRTLTISSNSPRPDLIVSTIKPSDDFSGAVIQGEAVEFAVFIQNVGWASASGFTVTLYADTNDNAVFDSGEMLYEWSDPGTVPYDVDGMGNNEIYLTVPSETVYPDSFTYDGSAHSMRAAISQDLDEWDITNNEGTTGAYPFLVNSHDVSPGELSIDSTQIADGDSLSVSLVIQNYGEDELTTDFDVAIYASADTVFDQADNLLATIAITDSIAANSSLTAVETIAIPDALNLNAFVYIFAHVDSGDIVAEIDETNNLTTDATTGETTSAAIALFYDNEDGARTFDIRIETFPPVLDEVTDTHIYLYDSAGAYLADNDNIGGGFGPQSSKFSRIDSNNLNPGTYHVLIQGAKSTDVGPYGFTVYGQGLTYPYFSTAINSNDNDPYETDDASSANVPTDAVIFTIAQFYSRYLGDSDADWFSFTLP